MGGYEMLFFGTGDRENPKGTSPVDRLYAIKDKNLSTSLTESNLVDVTADELQADGTTDARIADILQALRTSSGWFIQLLPTSSGEKCLSSTVVLFQTAFYTTFTPGAGDETDPCHVGEGVGRVYALQYQTGNAAFDFDLTNDTGGQTVLKKGDRSLNVGLGIPSGVVVTFVGGKAVGYIGVGGGVAPITPNVKQVDQSYWRIIF
jgi:type IV pilus assembly protein PilY1